MSDQPPPSQRPRRNAPEDLGRSIDRLFEGIEPADETAEQDIVLGGGDRPRAPSFPDSAKDADLLDDVEIRPVESTQLDDSAQMLRELEEEILLEGAVKAKQIAAVQVIRDDVPVIPLGASVTGGVDDVPEEEWSQHEALRRLEETVRSYLAGDDFERGPLYRRIGQLAWRFEEWSDFEPVAAAVERLAMGATAQDQDPLLLARRLLTAPVARWMTTRLANAARDEHRRTELVAAIARLGPEMASALADALIDASERVIRRAIIDGLVALGDEALPIVEDMSFDDRWFVVRNSMVVLREIAGERALEHYTAALGHNDARVRKEAVLALAHVGGEKAGMLVVGKLSDADPEVRQAAALAVGVLKAHRALKPLLAQLEEEDETSVQAALVLALGQIGDPGAVPAIEKRALGTLLKKPPTDLRVAAYRALGAIGTPHARKLLQDARTDRDPKIKETATRALEDLENRPPPARPAVVRPPER